MNVGEEREKEKEKEEREEEKDRPSFSLNGFFLSLSLSPFISPFIATCVRNCPFLPFLHTCEGRRRKKATWTKYYIQRMK